ncbi:3-hydroxy-9,10-secoandrosta-1,3,5(10)-triene-9,17-dione monooxygenase oxygenase subunit [Nocardia pseudovaccinii]|uniref:3-hydroxy-9,10-secoandrosta-1,3,5(10)-triene-9, 17-dione monooxygenase oxygenase subunit n=1 Tax=Nocardia pseudovaccinii TaxID=189540 RepID=UPI003D91853B
MDNDVAEAVRGLLPELAERAAQVDVTGEIPEQTMTDLIAAGVFRLLQPKWSGGLEADPNQFYDVVRMIAGVCGSTGWVASVLGVVPWHVALFDERAQREVWSGGWQPTESAGRVSPDHPNALICPSYAPVGRLTPVEGGYELSGRWRFASGCAHASWAVLGGTVYAENGDPVDIVSALVPRTDYRIDKVWDSVGLRGTGSHDLHIDRIFVPEYRTTRNYDVTHRRGPGQKLNTGPLYRMPFGTMYSYSVTAPMIGLAEGCLEKFLTRMRNLNRPSFGGGSLSTDRSVQIAVARAESDVDAAVLQLHRNLQDLYERARRREDIPMELRLRGRRDQVCGTERAITAIDLVFQAAGGMSRRRGNPIERAWRDAHTGSIHAGNDVESSLALCGRGSFGLYVDDMLV